MGPGDVAARECVGLQPYLVQAQLSIRVSVELRDEFGAGLCVVQEPCIPIEPSQSDDTLNCLPPPLSSLTPFHSQPRQAQH